jgi:hypothetical protein
VKSKSENVALGFRVKSGWATAVLLTGPARSGRVCRSFAIDLSDPKIPATRQPYHAAMGKLETNAAKLKARLQIVRRVTRQSIANVLADCRRRNFKVYGAGLVVGSQIDPGLIANPHIRAHALEGQLFRTALDAALHARGIHTVVLIERDAYGEAAIKLRKSIGEVQRAIQNLGRSAERPWRAEQKLASLAAWIALNRLA